MAIQIINTGTSPNAGNGDSIRTAFNKVNNNFEYLEDIVLGTGTNIVDTIHQVVEPMLVHELHQGLTAVYSSATDRIVLSTNNSSATFQNLRVIQTATLNNVVMTGTVVMGFIRGYDDVSIIKFADDGSLNFRMQNTYGLGSSQINLLDRVSGSFNILHQNSEASFGDFIAGNNYIYDDAGRPINIGRNSNINFFSRQGWTSSTPAAMSIRNTGTILVNSTLSIASSSFVLGGKRISVIDNSIYVNNEKANASTDRLTAGNFTATLTTAGNMVLPGNALIEYSPYKQPGNTVTSYGAVFSSSGPFDGVGSILFNGADRVEVVGGSHFDLTADNEYTIEWFQNPTEFNTGSIYTVFTLGTANDNPIEAYNYYLFPNTLLAATLENSFQLNATFTTTYLNTWSHVAIVKTTSSFSIFINGVQTVSTNTELFPTPTTTSSNLTIGAASNGFSYINPFQGYISNMRWEARAVYTATFVPPSSILTPSIHTRLLLATENSEKYLWDTSGLVPEVAQKLKFSLTTSSLSLSSYGELYLDYGGAYDGSDVDNTTIRVDIDQPNYTQTFIKNHSAGSTATSDVMIFNNQGTPDTNYIDLGINSTNYSEGPFGLHTPGSGYLFTKDVDLVIGTQTPGTKLVFHAGGSTMSDGACELNEYTWRFNRNVQTIVSTPAPLNFTVQNTMNNSAATAVYQALNNAGQYVQMGIQSTNEGAIDGQINPGDAFLHLHNSTATIHIGDTGDIKFYSDTSNNGYNGLTATLVMSRIDRSSTFGGHVLPATDLAYDLGSTSSQWRSLYVGTSTIYLGGTALSVSGGNLTVDGIPVVGGIGVTNPYNDVFVISNTTSNTTSDTGALVVAGGVGVGGNIHVDGYGHFGFEPTINYSNPLAVFTGDADSFTQLAIQNLSSGTSASSDIVLTTDDGTDELFYANFGINNSNFSDIGWTISGPHDGYLYVSNGNLTLGTTEPATYVKVHIGGTLLENVVATFREPGTDSTSSFTGALTVDGGIGITGQMHLQETLHVGNPNLLLPNAVFIGARDVDSYVQLAVQNANGGSSASSDFIATANNGDDSSFYIDLGINSNGYNNPEWTISGANDGYLYINGGSLTLGTDSTGTAVKVHVGGILAENVVAIFTETAATFAQHLLPALDLTYDLGSTSNQWRSLYVGTSTIYIGGIPITVNQTNNTLVVGAGPGVTPTTSTNLATESFVIDYLSQNGGSGGQGLPTITIPGEQGSVYKGLQVSYGVIHSNGSLNECNVNKIVIHKPAVVTLDIDPTGSQDYFRVSGLENSDVLAMFVLYGNTNGPKPLSELKAFAEVAIDIVILDGGAEGQYNTVDEMKTNFYSNYQALATAAGGLYTNFEFYETVIPVTSGTTAVITGTGAVFNFSDDGIGGYTYLGVLNGGLNYKEGHKLIVPGSLTGGADGVNDAIFTVVSVNPSGIITSATVTGASFSTAPVGGWNFPADNYLVGSGFSLDTIYLNNDQTFSNFNVTSQGSNYVPGDQVVLLGSTLQNGVSPDNDITITITSVDGIGAATNWVQSGTYSRVWRTNSISDGGEDQYDTANYINSFYAANIDYEQGQTITDGTGVFGTSSSYSFVYENSIFGLFVTGNDSSFISTSGNSGADGNSTTETGNIYGPDTVSQTFDNAVTHINLVGDTWAGPIVSFTRPDNSDQTIDILIPDDGEGAGVAIARDSNASGIFNPYREEGWNGNVSPNGTLWNIEGWEDLSDVESRTYVNLLAAFGGGGLGNKIVGAECVMYLPDNGKYYAVKFDSWTQGGNGGGFSYTRRELDLNNLQEGIRFADGTILKSAEGLGRVKSTASGNRRIEEVVGNNTVSVTAVETSVITFTASRTETNSQWFWLDNTTTTIDNIINNYPAYGVINISDMEFSVDGVTYYPWNGSGTGSGNENAYSVSPNSVSYNQGDTLYFRYKHGGQPVIWWDRNDLPSGGANFRGAVIDYHAYTGEATWIGTIHIVDDSGEQHIAHTEVGSGTSDSENDDLWLVENEGTISYRRIDGEAKTLKIHWTAKVFYGSEFYD